MTTTEHLERIVAKCRELLAIAEKRSREAWQSIQSDGAKHFYFVKSAKEASIGQRMWKSDADFITACAGPAEAGWRATIAAIESRLEEREQAWTNWELTAQISSFDAGSKSDYPFHNSLLDIIAAWPEELLK